jgi:hypothetical protein
MLGRRNYRILQVSRLDVTQCPCRNPLHDLNRIQFGVPIGDAYEDVAIAIVSDGVSAESQDGDVISVHDSSAVDVDLFHYAPLPDLEHETGT